LASTLSLFENPQTMRHLLREAIKKEQGHYWIGSDLLPYQIQNPVCSIVAMPYKIGGKSVGAIGMVGPMRLNYKLTFGTLRETAQTLSHVLSTLLYRYKISYREARPGYVELFYEEQKLLEMSTPKDTE
jgi:heat-inducible transcriptional repressor